MKDMRGSKATKFAQKVTKKDKLRKYPRKEMQESK